MYYNQKLLNEILSLLFQYLLRLLETITFNYNMLLHILFYKGTFNFVHKNKFLKKITTVSELICKIFYDFPLSFMSQDYYFTSFNPFNNI
jgi:hypothetical protein